MLLFSESTGPEDAPVLLMGSSLGTSLDMWDSQLALAERLRIVRHDHRGHGRSPVPPGPYEIADLGRDVLELMDALEIERASYCGLSIGGMVGMWLGANAPERIERLVLICTSAHLPPAEGWAERAAKVRAAGTVEVVADAVVARWLTPAYAEEHPELVTELRAMLVATDPEGYASACGAIERMDLRDQLGRIAAPTLVISGAGDEATPPEHQELIAASIPGARLETVDPAAHLAAVERPALVNELIASAPGLTPPRRRGRGSPDAHPPRRRRPPPRLATPALADGPGVGTPNVVTLGDSAISGEAGRWAGNTNQSSSRVDALGSHAYWDTPTGEAIRGCHRSKSAQAHIGGGVTSANFACSGAKTSTGGTGSGEDFKPGHRLLLRQLRAARARR